MKPTSVIFIILSVILIVGGTVTCISAQKMAETNGVELFSLNTDDDQNVIETHEFSEANTNKITIKLKDVHVNIIGEAETSYIKLTNITKNSFEFSINNKNLTVDDSVNLYSLFQFTVGGIDFNGLRHFLYYNQFKDKQKIVDIYVGKNDNIKQFDISVETGNIFLSGISKQADYLLKTGKGEIVIKDLKIISTISAEIDNGNISIDTTSLSGNIDFKIGTGDIYAKLKSNGYRGYQLSTQNGMIEYFGESKANLFNLEPMKKTSSFTADVENGDIIIELNQNVDSNFIP